jgi:hypothetical protein
MTLVVTGPEALARALRLLCIDIERGAVVSCSLHYEPTSVARLSICYLTGEAAHSKLPDLPGVAVAVVDETTDTEER